MASRLDDIRPIIESPKVDRRTRYTLNVIEEAFFELLREKGFAKTSVTDICKMAEINRGTFYLHYEDKYELLNAIIDEALDADPLLDGSPAALCQRAPVNDDYLLLYKDRTIFPLLAARVIQRSAPVVVPEIMERTGLAEHEAELLFTFNATGNLAVNQALGWKRGEEFRKAQSMLSLYTDGGLDAVARGHSPSL